MAKSSTAERIIDAVYPSGMPNAVHTARRKGKQMGSLPFVLYSLDLKYSI